MTTPMLQLEARLQSSVRGRFPHWFRGRRRYLAAPLLRTVGRWSRLDLLDGFIKASGHLHGFAFVEAALEWVAQRRAVWNEAHQRVIEALHALARNGTELV
ncbi:MAG: hypothetical protein ACREO4_14315, partial [Lysobacter sp.]